MLTAKYKAVSEHADQVDSCLNRCPDAMRRPASLGGNVSRGRSSGSGQINQLNVSGDGKLDMPDPISSDGFGTTVITKSGTGRWKLDGDNNFTGAPTFAVGAGTLDRISKSRLEGSRWKQSIN
ncbi:MAG: hypothetical protein K0Q77_2051 [Anaerosporomusa subterranea]|jgi:autotransporter-associated beta strand protein|nr:hypothetical protein [Anaerosporomusa subterranea]